MQPESKGRRTETQCNTDLMLLTYKLSPECRHSVAHIGRAVLGITVSESATHTNFVTDTPQELVVFFDSDQK
jgi:hypothetical protein